MATDTGKAGKRPDHHDTPDRMTTPGRPRRCYGCDQAEAMYEAHLDHDTTPVVLLCDACAIWERAAGSVVWMRTLAGLPAKVDHESADVH